MGRHAHEGIALYHHIKGIGSGLSGGQIEGSQLAGIVGVILDILQAPVAEGDDGSLFGRKQGRCRTPGRA